VATVYRQTATFRDAKGYTSTMRWFSDTSSHASAIITAIEDVVNAALQSAQGVYTHVPIELTYGAAETFLDVQDKAELLFADAGGGVHRYQVPAPLIDVFNTDTETVLESAVTAVTSAFLAGAFAEQGTALSLYLGGKRRRARNPKRPALAILGPALD
jgi:hypothetical protein